MAKRSGKKTDRPEFITADHLNGDRPVEVTIGDYITPYIREDNTVSLFIEVALKGKAYTLSVRCAGPDRISLQDQIGRNLIDWPGKKIKLYAQEGSRGGSFVNVYDAKRSRRN